MGCTFFESSFEIDLDEYVKRIKGRIGLFVSRFLYMNTEGPPVLFRNPTYLFYPHS